MEERIIWRQKVTEPPRRLTESIHDQLTRFKLNLVQKIPEHLKRDYNVLQAGESHSLELSIFKYCTSQGLRIRIPMRQTEQHRQLDPIEISIEKQSNSFKKFLGLPDNERILFSGIFGIGKTYFLNKFFEENDEYIGIHLYPTNYAVSSNEDIFEYIKFDILYELISNHKIYLDTIEVGTLETIAFFSPEEQYNIILKFVEAVPQIGKKVLDIIRPLQEVLSTLQGKSAALSLNEGEEIKKLERHLRTKKGSILENDFYTELITKLIDQVRVREKKQIVVIVDDLDRIDPEHIFRLLNIFAVHFDRRKISEYTNKFGIDKVVLSCDVNNIRLIFGARYGLETDFNGYIDKFYSKEVYHFDNKNFIAEVVEAILVSITFASSTTPVFFEKNGMLQFLIYLLQSMIMSGALNLRTLLRLHGKNIPLFYRHLTFTVGKMHSYTLPVLQVFDFILPLYETQESVLKALKKTTLAELEGLSFDENWFYDQFRIIADYKIHKFRPNKEIVGLPYIIDSSRQYMESFSQEKDHISPETLKEMMIRSFEIYLGVKNIPEFRKNW